MFWIASQKLRKLVILTFGYDPSVRNVDQSPFHGNEAGSQACNTIALKGAQTVPRDRVSLNSVTDSSQERISLELPRFELMFRAEGNIGRQAERLRGVQRPAVHSIRGDGAQRIASGA